MTPGPIQRILTLAVNVGVEVEVWDMRDVPLAVCVERDEARGALVGADAINSMYLRYVA